MRLICFAVFLCSQMFASTLIYPQEKPASTDVSGDIEWVFDISNGQKISRETGRPMFIVFRCER